jgi:hypothetical protein
LDVRSFELTQPSRIHAAGDQRDEVDVGRFVDPAEAFQQFMLGLYDLEDEARESGYSHAAVLKLHEARLLFLAEFEAKFPGYGKGRAVWR